MFRFSIREAQFVKKNTQATNAETLKTTATTIAAL
jgi:hypothetical protein